MKNEVIECLVQRRSIKKYRSEQVDEATLQEILCAGTYAACGRGLQAAVMVVVQDAETRETLRRMNATLLGNPDMDPFYGAPTVIVVLANADVPTYVEDGSLVMGNLMNAAHALGVGSCWIHRAREEFKSEEGKALLKAWGVEGNYVGIGHCILGYADGDAPKARPRKENYIYRV